MDTVPFLLCELGAPLFTNLKGAGTYFMCIPAMNRRMYKTLVDITSAGVFVVMYQEETAGGRFCRLLKTSAQITESTLDQKGGTVLVTINGEEKTQLEKQSMPIYQKKDTIQAV